MQETKYIQLRRADSKCMVILGKCSVSGEGYEQSKEPLHLISEQSRVTLGSDFRRYLHTK